VRGHDRALQTEARREIHFTCRAFAAILCAVMDKFWSIAIVPIGILACFSPALIAYWITEKKNPITSEPVKAEAKPAAAKKK
jgi:hypothetical protein